MSDTIHSILLNPFGWWIASAIVGLAFFASPGPRMLERALTAPDPEEVDGDHLEGTAAVENTNPRTQEPAA